MFDYYHTVHFVRKKNVGNQSNSMWLLSATPAFGAGAVSAEGSADPRSTDIPHQPISYGYTFPLVI